MPPLTTSISPSVSFFPDTASAVQFRGVGFDGLPTYLYTFGNITPAQEAVIPLGEDGADGEFPAVPEQFVALPSAVGNVTMTKEQWNAWGTAADDNAYQIACLCANLNITPVK